MFERTSHRRVVLGIRPADETRVEHDRLGAELVHTREETGRLRSPPRPSPLRADRRVVDHHVDEIGRPSLIAPQRKSRVERPAIERLDEGPEQDREEGREPCEHERTDEHRGHYTRFQHPSIKSILRQTCHGTLGSRLAREQQREHDGTRRSCEYNARGQPVELMRRRA